MTVCMHELAHTHMLCRQMGPREVFVQWVPWARKPQSSYSLVNLKFCKLKFGGLPRASTQRILTKSSSVNGPCYISRWSNAATTMNRELF